MTLTLELSPDLTSLRPTLDGIRAALPGPPMSAEDWHAVDLVLMETLTNVLRHAAPATPVHLTLTPDRAGLRVAVEDEGAPMPDGALPAGRLPDPDPTPETAQDHGYGWFLIRTLARDITYVRTAGRNRLTFRIVGEGGADD